MVYEFLASFVTSVGRFVQPLPLGNAPAILDAITASGCPRLSVMLPVGYAETAIWHLAPMQPVGSSLTVTLMGPPFCPASEKPAVKKPPVVSSATVGEFAFANPATGCTFRSAVSFFRAYLSAAARTVPIWLARLVAN
jgi:hypothetical protein